MVQTVTFEAPETGPNAPEVTPPVDQNKPAWMPEGFTGDEAALSKSWQDQRAEITRLQQKLAQLEKSPTQVSDQKPGAQPPTDNAPKTDEQKPATSEDEAAQKIVNEAGLDVTPFQQEWNTTGDVSEESRAKIAAGLEKVLGKDARMVVDQFIEGRKATLQNDTAMFMEAAGGEENYRAMAEWAAKNMPREQALAYNKAVSSGDRSSVLFAIQGLKAQYEAANGRQGVRLTGKSAGVSGDATPYLSSAEMVRDMSDPKYKTDPAFQEKVRQRLALSNF